MNITSTAIEPGSTVKVGRKAFHHGAFGTQVSRVISLRQDDKEDSAIVHRVRRDGDWSGLTQIVRLSAIADVQAVTVTPDGLIPESMGIDLGDI